MTKAERVAVEALVKKLGRFVQIQIDEDPEGIGDYFSGEPFNEELAAVRRLLRPARRG